MWNIKILGIILFILHVATEVHTRFRYIPKPLATEDPQTCLTGYMTNVQNWVDSEGSLTSAVELTNTIDLSAADDVVPVLYQQIEFFRDQAAPERRVKFLSMARCKLNKIPTVFQLQDRHGRPLAETVEFMTLYGNEFMDISAVGQHYDMELNATKAVEVDVEFGFQRTTPSAWSAGFNQVTFSHLQELDLRRCKIEVISDYLFLGMPRLEALYLGENNIVFVSNHAFNGLANLVHLDISFNSEEDSLLTFESEAVLRHSKKLASLDLSHTKLDRKAFSIFRGLGRSFQRLSLCHNGLPRLADGIFNQTSLKYLDLSGNPRILSGPNVLSGLEEHLQILYADGVALKTAEIFERFCKLQVLQLRNNEVNMMTSKTAKTLKSLQILDLSNNRLTSWFKKVYGYMPELRFLSLRQNNLNLITVDMIEDFEMIYYLGLGGNFFICNCHTRELFELALKNEAKASPAHYFKQPKQNSNTNFNYHSGFADFNRVIQGRTNVSRVCFDEYPCDDKDVGELESEGNFLLIDYHEYIYQCLIVAEGRSAAFSSIPTCQQSKRDISLEDAIGDSWNKLLALIIIPAVVFPVLIFTYIFRRNFKYCFITMRNSTLLSLISKKDPIDDDTIFNYDVFVSYCNEDRNWVLDHLLPTVEKDCNVSVCLHERDFQVGLSILENIVSCMDRSRSIMLIISKKFLMSQWCQFEMHLAQHRLLETRREDLILVLLEEIPRRLRPTTLHYLMLTKTYIVWPHDPSEEPVFWKRLMKSFTTRIRQQVENSSLA